MRCKHLAVGAALFLGCVIGTAAGQNAPQRPAGPPAPKAHSQVVALSGLNKPVDILIDKWGVPHLFAKNEADLFFAQGFNAARDRLFQLDLWRRRGLGRLSEVLGPSFIEQDRAARLFLYRGDMPAEWGAYSPNHAARVKRIVRAFTAGINAFIDYLSEHPDKLPWEFKEFGYLPSRWAPEDVVRVRSHGLTRNLLSELARARTVCAANVKADEIRLGLQPLWETKIPGGLDACLPREVARVFQLATEPVRLTRSPRAATAATLKQDEADAAGVCEVVPEGSNNWVVAPAKSATGRAIMANDPHRSYSTPSLRYIAHLSAPGIDVIGAGEPALPGIHIGHNGTIAFGLTIFPIDQEDLYVYELKPNDAQQYRYNGSWEPLRVIREEIAVKRAAPVNVELTFTRHGPVIYLDRERGRAFAVRSCWLEPGMSPYFCSIESMRARSFPEFKASMNHWGAPTVNHVYADVKGNIGWLPRGLAPKRANWDGLLPVPGDGRFEWNGFWKGDELPIIYNPRQGWFATANQMNLPDDYPYRERNLGFEWTNPSRFLRISEVLGSLPLISLEDSEHLQNDTLSIPARRLSNLLNRLNPDNPTAKAALELLRGWDFREGRESAPAALFEVWQSRHLRSAFRYAVLPQAAADAIASTDLRVMLEELEKPSRRFGDNPEMRRDALLITTLSAAYSEMEVLQGPDPSKWQWGRLHYNLSEHAFSQAVDEAMQARTNVGPFAKDGSESTPNQSSYRAEDFRQTNGPSFRIVVDVGNWDNSRAVNYPGQSGNPDDPHYRDLAPLWLKGQYFPLLYSRSAIEKATELRIRLAPYYGPIRP